MGGGSPQGAAPITGQQPGGGGHRRDARRRTGSASRGFHKHDGADLFTDAASAAHHWRRHATVTTAVGNQCGR